MRNPDKSARLIIVCGLPGSGKATLARDLARELHYLSAPADVLFERIRRRGRETPPIGREHVSRWLEIFQPPTTDEMVLFDEPLAAGPAPE